MRQLSPPPTIKERLQAALEEDAPYQIVHYNRLEGATEAAVELAKENEGIMLFVRPGLKRLFEERGVACVSSFGIASEIRMRNLDKQVIIADCIDERVLRELARFGGMKVIAIKSIKGSADKVHEQRRSNARPNFACLDCDHFFYGNPVVTDGRRCPKCGGVIVPRVATCDASEAEATL